MRHTEIREIKPASLRKCIRVYLLGTQAVKEGEVEVLVDFKAAQNFNIRNRNLPKCPKPASPRRGGRIGIKFKVEAESGYSVAQCLCMWIFAWIFACIRRLRHGG